MGRPRIEAGQVATTERLLHAAELEFGEHGFAGAKLQDIAARAGISRPSLLYHFKTKDGLYTAVVEGVLGEIGAALQGALEGDAAYEARVEQLVGAFVGFVRGRPAASRLVLREIMDDKGPGQAILLRAGVPLLQMVEAFLREQGKDSLPPDIPIRGALLQIVSTAFVHAASGPLGPAFWGDEDPHLALARQLFIRRKE